LTMHVMVIIQPCNP